MKEALTQLVNNSIQSNKTGQSVAAVAAGTGLATFLEVLNPILGFVATIFGITVSIAFIISKRRSDKREEEKHSMEMKLLQRQLDE